LAKRKRGDVWFARYRLPDKEVRVKLGPAWAGKGRPPAGYLTAKTARAALDAILTDARRGTLAGMVKTGATFQDAAAEWLRYIETDRKRRPSTVTDYANANRRLVAEFGSKPVEQVTAAMIDGFREELTAELSDRTVNKYLVQLHGIFRRAQRVYGLPSNPAALVDRQPLKRSGEFNVLSPAEVEALARAAKNEQDAALFRVAAYTGLRLGELRALRWDDVAFDKHLLHVRRSFTRGQVGAPKSGRVRSVPLLDAAAKALDGLSRREMFTDADDLVFPNPVGAPFDDARLRLRFLVALAKAGLKRMRFHDLRHTFGTIAVQAFPLTDVKVFMGHADISTTMIYVHHAPLRRHRHLPLGRRLPVECTQ
jgi:integrase